MTDITFKRITPHESRVYHDGDLVGEVYRQEDILNRGFALLCRAPVRRSARAQSASMSAPAYARS